MAGTLKSCRSHLLATLGMLMGLAAGATSPAFMPLAVPAPMPMPMPMPVSSSVAPSVPLQVEPELADSPAELPSSAGLTPDSKPRPALLDGEVAREFERGGASWYGGGFHGRRTASGERFDMHALTAAHRTLPFGTLVRVHSLVNGRDVEVRITDRGPFSHSRIIDVSRAAAQELGMLGMGFKEVVLMVPESTPPVAQARPAVVKKARRASKRPQP